MKTNQRILKSSIPNQSVFFNQKHHQHSSSMHEKIDNDEGGPAGTPGPNCLGL